MTRWIYALQAGIGGPIKIGKSRDPYGRLGTLRSISNINMLPIGVTADLGNSMEQRIHEQLLGSRHFDPAWGIEWFLPTDEVWEFCSSLQPFPTHPRTANGRHQAPRPQMRSIAI